MDSINLVLVCKLKLASVPAWEAASAFLESVDLLHRRTVEADNLIRRVVRVTHHSLKTGEFNDQFARLYINCRLLDWDDKDILPHLFTGELDHVPKHTLQCWEAVMKDLFCVEASTGRHEGEDGETGCLRSY